METGRQTVGYLQAVSKDTLSGRLALGQDKPGPGEPSSPEYCDGLIGKRESWCYHCWGWWVLDVIAVFTPLQQPYTYPNTQAIPASFPLRNLIR
ncbi:hypothetical protein J6590_073912 [Homalodisca vitripennis]|nr:hypothetical protein J6590_073912 [Homalodisca vitripennis]